MTTSSIHSPVTRETPAMVRDLGLRSVIVNISGGVITLRCKGLRTSYEVSVSELYTRAVKEAVLAAKAERKARKKKR